MRDTWWGIRWYPRGPSQWQSSLDLDTEWNKTLYTDAHEHQHIRKEKEVYTAWPDGININVSIAERTWHLIKVEMNWAASLQHGYIGRRAFWDNLWRATNRKPLYCTYQGYIPLFQVKMSLLYLAESRCKVNVKKRQDSYQQMVLCLHEVSVDVGQTVKYFFHDETFKLKP